MVTAHYNESKQRLEFKVHGKTLAFVDFNELTIPEIREHYPDYVEKYLSDLEKPF